LSGLAKASLFGLILHQTNIFREVALMTPLLLPAAYEAGDAETATLVVTLIPAPVDVEELAARLGEMDGIALTIHWTFLRTNGLPVAWKFLPKKWKRSRELVQRSTRVVFDGGLSD
jgi:hypothetical protein